MMFGLNSAKQIDQLQSTDVSGPVKATVNPEETETMKTYSQPTTDISLTTAEAREKIMEIQHELEFLCSLQVSKFEESKSDEIQSISANFATLEPSFDLSNNGNIFLEEIFEKEGNPLFTNGYYSTNLTFEEFLKSNPDMTFTELSSNSMDEGDAFADDMQTSSPTIGTSPMPDETTNSSSEDLKRNTINRRGLKKSGGPVRKLARFGNKEVIKYSDEYHDRRVKNNEAVKKSRTKAKEKQKETQSRMQKLAEENRTLNDRVDHLLKELQVLKSLYKELNQDVPVAAIRALERVNVH